MIYWNKPLRTIPSGKPATTGIVGGVRVLTWGSESGVSVDYHGRTISTHVFLECDGREKLVERGTTIVENVPEEPRDHIVIRKSNGMWHIQDGPHGRLFAKSQTESMINMGGACNFVAVKVPV